MVLVGEDPASQVYVKSKGKAAHACGFRSVQHDLPATTSEAELLALVHALNADPAMHGILVQLPLPKHIDSTKVLETHRAGQGRRRLSSGQCRPAGDRVIERALVPCTPAGAMLLIEEAAKALGRDLAGAEAVVVGRSNIVGKPMAQLLLRRTPPSPSPIRAPAICPRWRGRADILVAAVGRPEMIQGDWIKPGAMVIDVGINRVPGAEPRQDPAGRRRRASPRRSRSPARSPRCRAASGR